MVRHPEARHVVVEEPQIAGLVPEGQTAGVRVQTVGADDQVEPAGRAALEGDLDPVRGLGERRDRVSEDVLDQVLGALVHDPGQLAAEDLHVAAHHLGRQVHARAAVGVHDALPAHVRLTGVDLLPDAHFGEHRAVDVAAEVDGEAAAAQGGRPLDDGDTGAVAGEVQGEGGSGDAGAGDEDVEVAEAASGVRHGGQPPGRR